MALISIFPPNLGFCLKPHPPQSHNLQLCSKAVPLIPRKKLIKPIVNQALSKVEIPLRRTGKHHPNLWGDDFIQSLPKHPYEAPLYAERCGSLISEIKDMFSASAENVSPLLVLVDNIERLGIDRHFQKEIKEALDFIYRHWGECQRDLDITALGFRILRLHRYPVSPGMLGAFRTANGQFLCSTAQTEEVKIKGILNLFRASHIAFRGEKILDEAKEFSTTYLNQAMEKSEISSNLLQEISFNLEYGWYSNLPRLEAKKYIQIYGENESRARMAGNEKLLLLAKMDFNAIQSLHQQELKTYSRWWRESGLSKLEFARHRHVEYFFMACAICEDERWDPTSIDHLPEYMKVLYMALYETVNEMDREAEKIQGRDTLIPSKDAWEGYADAMMQEAEWLATSHIPTLEEHIENGTVSLGTRATTLQPVLTIDEILSDNILPKIDYPSRFMDILCVSLRLRGDIKSFKGEIARGETNSSVACYMRDNPGSTEEDALDYIKNLLDERLKELNWEYLKNDGVPTCSKDYAYDITRGYLHFYKERDGFSISNKDIQNHVTQILIEPINM
ncbi:alpha pinene synthase, chloroplastic-like isoform X2 [Cryptomeria japonica]|uniref:alpha pinene synthase, chloroplastic-like isoform X2 n=1 Tax=Cryptomeria japonica TaxID=3369 RepID=UPI0027DA5CD3|nr:alpha pinene synthase, chloroplastic-like isoform X2 [Cryptomeria japonica]